MVTLRGSVRNNIRTPEADPWSCRFRRRDVSTLLVVGGGLFGSAAAAYARTKGIEAIVFDAALDGAASPAAAGLFSERWAGHKLGEHFHRALPFLEQRYGVRSIDFQTAEGQRQSLLCVPPAAMLESAPVRQRVTAVGDGWLEADGRVCRGDVYIAAGVWCEAFLPGLGVFGKAGSALLFAGERAGQIRQVAPGRQAIAFVRDAGRTYFSDGTAERHYTEAHDQQTLERAADLGLPMPPVQRLWGQRPYVAGGPVFRKLGAHTWLATGGRKMGTILAASFARRLVEEELPFRSG
jgi:glycine/D-amino acid oxidase-like deaminating enzyme